jgi:hypothetical protein
VVELAAFVVGQGGQQSSTHPLIALIHEKQTSPTPGPPA